MAEQSRRPFYGEYAWAFDLLVDRPVGQECAAIAAWFSERGVLPGATLLDAGCGTGRYAGELARRGYAVEGVDRSSELIETANQSVRGHSNSVSFRVGDLLALPVARYDGILCRGVLNDFVNDEARLAVFAAFAGALRRPGVLILDVREWEATRDRKQREPVFERAFERIEARHVHEHHGTRSGAPAASPVRNPHSGQRRWRTFERLSLRDAMLDENRTRVGL